MALETGTVVDGRYRIVGPLAQGGMGAIYRAWDTRLNRPVALKEMIPQPSLGTDTLDQLRQQFENEAKILATLSHPNLVRVSDYFSWEGNEYLVMDFVEGESLADRIQREGPQSEANVLLWAGQLLNALSYCHNKGVLHRDIKPQNIIINTEGNAILVDFGLVKLWDPKAPETRTVMRGAGTPEYAPPEQYDMGMGHTDPRSDVYSFGATLYHAFTGRTPPTATQRMANPASFISPRRIRADISPRTEDAVLKGMEVAMNSRFQSAASMAEALGLAVHHRPTAPQQSTTGGTMIIPGARLDTHAPAEYPSAPMKPPRKRGIGLWLGIGGGALACLALAACIVIVALGGGGDATPTPVAQATATSTAISTPMPTLQPTNTPESVGVPTETPAPLQPTPIAGGNVLLEDSFDDPNSGWEEKEFDNGTVGYGDGYYYILSAGESLMNWGTAGQDFGDVIIDVDTIQVSAPTNNNNGYGVMCRVQENGDGYLLRISGDGYYSIYRILEGAFEALVSWTSSSVVRQGNATNHIRAVCEGDQLTLIVNGEQLAQTTDASFASGDVGMSATTYEVEATEIRFDDVRVVSAQEAALFSDDFSDPNSGWDVWETGTGDVVDYGNGVYRVYEMEGYWMWGASNHHFTDIVIDVDATQISAPANNNNGYGVFCRVQPNEWGDGYAVTISGDGFYSIQKISQGDWTELVEWTRSNVINQGNATNHIQVVCSGSRIALFVNDQFIDEVIDADYASGDVSLAATTYEDTATEIHFDNLVIRRANP